MSIKTTIAADTIYKVNAIYIEIRRTSGVVRISADALDADGEPIPATRRTFDYPDPVALIKEYFPNPKAVFNKADQYVQTKIGGTIEPNDDVVL